MIAPFQRKRLNSALGAIALLVSFVGTAAAQIQVLNPCVVTRVLPELREVDFEDLPLFSDPFFRDPPNGLPNPLTLEGITLRDSVPVFRPAFCSSPTCQPDPDNPSGGNIELFLNRGGSISFRR